jgi:hypothetical protein
MPPRKPAGRFLGTANDSSFAIAAEMTSANAYK